MIRGRVSHCRSDQELAFVTVNSFCNRQMSSELQPILQDPEGDFGVVCPRALETRLVSVPSSLLSPSCHVPRDGHGSPLCLAWGNGYVGALGTGGLGAVGFTTITAATFTTITLTSITTNMGSLVNDRVHSGNNESGLSESQS